MKPCCSNSEMSQVRGPEFVTDLGRFISYEPHSFEFDMGSAGLSRLSVRDPSTTCQQFQSQETWLSFRNPKCVTTCRNRQNANSLMFSWFSLSGLLCFFKPFQERWRSDMTKVWGLDFHSLRLSALFGAVRRLRAAESSGKWRPKTA